MAGRVRRVRGMLKSALNSLLEPAEDPHQIAVDADQRQRALLAQIRQALVEIGATKHRLSAQAATAHAQVPRLEAQARDALRAGRDDLARLALQRRRIIAAEAETLEEHVREMQDEEQRLSLVEHRLTAQIEAMVARQQLIAARHTAADAQVRLGEALTGASDDLADVALALERTEQETERLQARAAAIAGLVDSGALATPALAGLRSHDEALAQLDGTQEIERELAALKQELSTGTP
jgi:phage shock protein A